MERAQAPHSHAGQASRKGKDGRRVRFRGSALTLYLDTDALVKLLIDEPGRDVALVAVSEADSVSTSHIAYVETRSALARMLAGRRLTARLHIAATEKLESLWAELAIVPVDDRVVTDAAALAERHILRAYDAVHLSSSLLVHGVREVTFACWDSQLREAAAVEGLEVIPTRA